jgi:hypothetical protein
VSRQALTQAPEFVGQQPPWRRDVRLPTLFWSHGAEPIGVCQHHADSLLDIDKCVAVAQVDRSVPS